MNSTIYASFVQIYNEKIYDLLYEMTNVNDKKQTELKIREDA